MSRCVLSLGIANKFVHNTQVPWKQHSIPKSIWIFGCQRLLKLNCNPPRLWTLEHHEKQQPRLKRTSNWQTKAEDQINLDFSATLSVQPAERVLNLCAPCGRQTNKKVTAAGAIWAFLTSGSSKSYTKPPQPSQHNTTYHIHILTRDEGEEFAEADFSSKDRPVGSWVGGGERVAMVKTIGVNDNKTVHQGQILCCPLSFSNWAAWASVWASMSNYCSITVCTFMEKKDTKTQATDEVSLCPYRKTDQEELIHYKMLWYFSVLSFHD